MKWLLFLATFLTISLPVAASATGTRGPSLTLGQTTASVGNQVAVHGAGWPAGDLVEISVCGNNDLDGSQNCVFNQENEIGVQRDGSFLTDVSISAPPTPCPCVVAATSLSSSNSVTAPIDILNVATTTPTIHAPSLAVGRLNVLSADVSGHHSWGEWIGGSSERTLTLTLQNAGDRPAGATSLTLSIAGSTTPLLSSSDKDFEPGTTRTFTATLSEPSSPLGYRTIRGYVVGLGPPVAFQAQNSSYPWALPVFVLALAVIALFLNRFLGTWKMKDDDDEATAQPEQSEEEPAFPKESSAVEERQDELHQAFEAVAARPIAASRSFLKQGLEMGPKSRDDFFTNGSVFYSTRNRTPG